MTVVNLFNAAMLVLDNVNQAIAFVAERAGLDTSDVLAALAADESSAPALAEYFVETLGADKKRAGLLAKYQKAATAAANALDALRKYDATAVEPFAVESLFEIWRPNLADATPRDYSAERDRNYATANLQGKSAGAGRGHRKSVWTRGTYILDSGKFAGFALELTDSALTVSRDNGAGEMEIVYHNEVDWSVESGPGSVTRAGNEAGAVMNDLVDGKQTRRNWPGAIWKMPQIETD